MNVRQHYVAMQTSFPYNFLDPAHIFAKGACSLKHFVCTLHTSSRHIHINGLSFCHRQKCCKLSEMRSRVKGQIVSAACPNKTEQEQLANSSTMALPILCNGYLALTAAAKATSNGPHFRQDPLE